MSIKGLTGAATAFVIAGVVAGTLVARAGDPPKTEASSAATQTTLVFQHDAVGNVASTLDDIRKHSDAAVDYTDSQLMSIADGICRDGAQTTTDAWAKSGHDVDLLAAIGDAVVANPYYCNQQMDPWGLESSTPIA